MYFFIGLLLLKVVLAAGESRCDFEGPCADWTYDKKWNVDPANKYSTFPPKDSSSNNHFLAAFLTESTKLESKSQSRGDHCLFFNIIVDDPSSEMELRISNDGLFTADDILKVESLSNSWSSIYVDYSEPWLSFSPIVAIQLNPTNGSGIVAIDDLTILDSTCEQGFKDNKIKVLTPVVVTTIPPIKPTENSTIKITTTQRPITPSKTSTEKPTESPQPEVTTPKPTTPEPTTPEPTTPEPTSPEPTTPKPTTLKQLETSTQEPATPSTPTPNTQSTTHRTTSEQPANKTTPELHPTPESTPIDQSTTASVSHSETPSTKTTPKSIFTPETPTPVSSEHSNITTTKVTQTPETNTTSQNPNVTGIVTESPKTNTTEAVEVTTNEVNSTTHNATTDKIGVNSTTNTPDVTMTPEENSTFAHGTAEDENAQDENKQGNSNKLAAKYWILIVGGIGLVLIGAIVAFVIIRKKRAARENSFFYAKYENTSTDIERSNPTYTELDGSTNNFTFNTSDTARLAKNDYNELVN